jgi:hypothetical protein
MRGYHKSTLDKHTFFNVPNRIEFIKQYLDAV